MKSRKKPVAPEILIRTPMKEAVERVMEKRGDLLKRLAFEEAKELAVRGREDLMRRLAE